MSDNYGNKSRAEGLEYEDLLLESMNSMVENSTYMPVIDAKRCDDIFGKKTTTKADGMFVDAKTKGISIKNPGRSAQSIQMFCPSKNRLITVLDNMLPMPQEVKDYFELWLGQQSKEKLFEVCKKTGVDPSSLEYEKETRRIRLKHSSIPEVYQIAFSQYFNNPSIKSLLFDLSFSKGFCKNKENHAEYMLWCDPTAAAVAAGRWPKKVAQAAGLEPIEALKSTTSHLSICKMSELKNKVMKFDWAIREDKHTVWELGPLTVQMKGSGKKSSAAYHNPQFNASLNDLKKHCPDVFVDGDLVAMHNFIKNM